MFLLTSLESCDLCFEGFDFTFIFVADFLDVGIFFVEFGLEFGVFSLCMFEFTFGLVDTFGEFVFGFFRSTKINKMLANHNHTLQ